jgi:hypothetical protein
MHTTSLLPPLADHVVEDQGRDRDTCFRKRSSSTCLCISSFSLSASFSASCILYCRDCMDRHVNIAIHTCIVCLQVFALARHSYAEISRQTKFHVFVCMPTSCQVVIIVKLSSSDKMTESTKLASCSSFHFFKS